MGLKSLEPEIQRIKEGDVALFVKRALMECVDESFFILPASATGKFHPQPSSGVGGLVRHVKAACYIASEMKIVVKELDHDLVQAALILHDIGKPDWDHPIKAAAILKPLKKEYPTIYKEVCRLIACHMGQWNNKKGEEIEFPIPQKPDEMFVHMCDYISSRKGLAFIYNQYTDYSEFLY